MVRVSQQKTGKPLDIPILSFLAEAIKATPVDHLMFLIDETGKPFTPGNFTKWFTAQCRRIGLTGLSPHGLRKAAARRFAEAGCSANQIASYTGHASLREVARYTAAADQLRMAVGAMERLEAHITATSIVSPSG